MKARTQVQNIHRREIFIPRCIEEQKKKLTSKNFETFISYNNNMIMDGLAHTTRYKNLCHFARLSDTLQNDWIDVTENDLKLLVASLMSELSPSGKETSYTFALKVSLVQIVRFVKLGVRTKPENGELKILRFIKKKKPKGTIVRSDLPTNEEMAKIIRVCADSSRDKAMFSFHEDAGTRAGELLALQIKDLTIDKFGGIIKIPKEGKTGVREVRIVKSVPYLTRWLNDHPSKNDPESPLFVYIELEDSFGQSISYAGANKILKKRVKQAKITKRITTHLIRHKACTDMAGKLTEAEMRMRFGWEENSHMPSRYIHLNQEDLDSKVLQIMGVKKDEFEDAPKLRECVYCKIKQPMESQFCDICSRPLDVIDAMHMEKSDEEKMKAIAQEALREAHSSQSTNDENQKLQEQIARQAKELEELKKQ